MTSFIARFSSRCAFLCLIAVSANAAAGAQEKIEPFAESVFSEERAETTASKPLLVSTIPKYYHPQDGVSIDALIERALTSNQELAAARLDIDKAHARLGQARQRPNPTLEFEQQSGRLVGQGGDASFTIGASLPIEIYGRRTARVSAAAIAVAASLAEVRNRERQLAANVLTNYSEALAALRELEVTENLLELDLQTTVFVQIRVDEGETAPLELNLLQAEVERLRARRLLAEGRLESSITQLKLLSGMPFDEPLRLRERINTAALPALPVTANAAIDVALRTRPDIALANIEEQAATAGLRLVRAQSRPDLTAYTRYSQGKSAIDLPGGVFPQRDRSLTFGVAVSIPLFNKNQGAKAEAEIGIRQAKARREYAERIVRGEVISAFQRIAAATRAVAALETAAVPRTAQNVVTFRRVYELGNITITDLITEQRRLLDATRDLTDALTVRYRAQVDLNIALGAGGVLPEEK